VAKERNKVWVANKTNQNNFPNILKETQLNNFSNIS
jgi:hypothetical protein